jgi:hypothetical protein
VPRDPPRPPAVRARLAEQHSRLAAGTRWLHEYRCWVQHAGPTEAVLRWPAPVEVVSATVGPIDGPGRPLESSPGGDGAWRIPLPATGTVHAIVIRYRHPKGESPSRPDLRAPVLEGATSSHLLRTIEVPAGWTLTGDADHSVTGSTRRALAALTRAEGRLDLCRETAKRTDFAETYDRARHRLESHLSLAHVALDAGGDGSTPLGPEGQTLQGWLDRLKQEARTLPRAAVGTTELREAEDGTGSPASWFADASDNPPAWRLEPTQARATRTAFVLSAEWLAVLLIVAMISMSNFSRAVARHLWPEQLVGLGLVCWHLAGPGLPAAALVLLGVAGRSAVVLSAIRALFRRTQATGSALRSRA